jgi:hypothetical protein
MKKLLPLLAFLVPLCAHGQTDTGGEIPFVDAYKRTYRIARTDGSTPHIDGRLDDPFWDRKYYVFDFAPRPVRYVKVKVNALDICPVWHYASGNDALTSISEVSVL